MGDNSVRRRMVAPAARIRKSVLTQFKGMAEDSPKGIIKKTVQEYAAITCKTNKKCLGKVPDTKKNTKGGENDKASPNRRN